MGQRFSFLTCCVESDGESIIEMVEKAREVTYGTFVRHCNWRPWAKTLGYQVGPGADLQLCNDWHVHYFKSTYRGEPCYYAKHSSIEHIFTVQAQPAEIRRPW